MRHVLFLPLFTLSVLLTGSAVVHGQMPSWFQSALSSTGLATVDSVIIDVESWGTNGVYSLDVQQSMTNATGGVNTSVKAGSATLAEIESRLRKYVAINPQVRVFIHPRDQVTPDTLYEVLLAVLRAGCRNCSLAIMLLHGRTQSELTIPLEMGRIKTQQATLPFDPYARDGFPLRNDTNKFPNHAVEPTRAPEGARGSPHL